MLFMNPRAVVTMTATWSETELLKLDDFQFPMSNCHSSLLVDYFFGFIIELLITQPLVLYEDKVCFLFILMLISVNFFKQVAVPGCQAWVIMNWLDEKLERDDKTAFSSVLTRTDVPHGAIASCQLHPFPALLTLFPSST